MKFPKPEIIISKTWIYSLLEKVICLGERKGSLHRWTPRKRNMLSMSGQRCEGGGVINPTFSVFTLFNITVRTDAGNSSVCPTSLNAMAKSSAQQFARWGWLKWLVKLIPTIVGNSSMACIRVFSIPQNNASPGNSAEKLHWSSVGRYFKGSYMGVPNWWLEKCAGSQAATIFVFGRNLGRRSISYAEVKINCWSIDCLRGSNKYGKRCRLRVPVA